MKSFIFLYIDPGTGSMLFAVLVGALSTLVFLFRKIIMKLGFFLTGGRKAESNKEKIRFLIFSDDKRYWNVFRPVLERLEELSLDAEYWTMSEDDPCFKRRFEHIKCSFIGSGNAAFAKLNLARADICLSTTPGLMVYQWKRSKDINWYVHIFHSVDEGMVYRMFGLDFYDAVFLTGPIQERYIRELEKKRGLAPKELYLTGSTYMDELYKRVRAQGKTSKEDHEGINVLIAPSWGESGILSRFGEKFIDAMLGTDFNIIIRPHPQSVKSEAQMLSALKDKYKDNKRIEWNFDNDNFDVLNNSDVLISDFSSVLFDFALAMNKPIIYADTSFDTTVYDAAWFDEPLWRFRVLDKLGVKLKEEDFGRLEEVIKELVDNEAFEKGRREVAEEVWQYKGEAAKRVVDYLVLKTASTEGVSKS